MALVSPGVEVTIIDQSQYAPAASNSVPLIILATAQNKTNAAGTGVAVATTSANANKLNLISSQRDLINLYGNPFFSKTTDGTPVQGYELNEYGLLAAYSLMEVTNRCYVLRADIDLNSLAGSVGRPSGAPANGTYWLDTTSSTWGIYEFNQATGKFTNKVPTVITLDESMSGDAPKESIGSIGDYAIDARYADLPDPLNQSQYFYKNSFNQWIRLGGDTWLKSIATATGTGDIRLTSVGGDLSESQQLNIEGSTFVINVNDEYNVTVTASGSTVTDIAFDINSLGLDHISASVDSNKYLVIYSSSPAEESFIQFSAPTYGGTTETILDYLGLSSTTKYYQPDIAYGTSAEMPMWTTGQTSPRPTGSVWIKTSAAGAGINTVLAQYSSTTQAFIQKTVKLYPSITNANYQLDGAGGKNITAGTVVGDYSMAMAVPGSPIYLYERTTSGPTVVTGTIANPTFSVGDQLVVRVSTVGSAVLSIPYTLVINGTTAADFVTAWSGASIPNTTATVTAAGTIQLTHSLGGEIVLSVPGNNSSQAVLEAAGFILGATKGISRRYIASTTNSAAAQTSATRPTGGSAGAGATFNIFASGKTYMIDGVTAAGTGYSVGDLIVISGEQLGGTTPTNNLTLVVTELSSAAVGGVGPIMNSNGVIGVAYVSGAPNLGYYLGASNWNRITYIANEGAPSNAPLNKTNWFYSVIDQIDIMIQKQGAWIGYRNTAYDSQGNPTTSGINTTDSAGIILSTDAPTVQSDGITALSYGDLWLDSNDLENFPVISRWQLVDGVDTWVKIDNTDQTTNDGILFADARWGSTGDIDPSNDPIPSTASLLSSNYLDLDAPLAGMYPQGMLLFNTRRSGYNVKQYRTNYFTAANFPDQSLPVKADAWVSSSGLKTDGSPYMGRKAQRNLVTLAMKVAISTNMAIREEDTFMNLMACPGYPELQSDMIGLNNARNNTAYIIGDTPLRLSDQATALAAWAKNTNNAVSSGEDGLVTRDEYMGLFYPSGLATEPTNGTSVVVPASHMMLRTFLRNDRIAYPWLAAAGTRRGTIDNATSIGYIDALTGEFQSVKNRNSIRDVLYTNQINPLASFTGIGLLNYGNKNSKDTSSALDRTNVARLVCYIRERLQSITRPFIFEPNDALTRSQISAVVQTLFVDLVSKRGLYDYLVVCDTSNNTTARIDRNELYIDIAIEPTKSAEFIYIPVRILNTGGIAALSGQ
jgi:hypothetical protein